MLEATLVRALGAVRQKLADIDETLADWMAERERRRRCEALILKGIIRSRGSQRQAALATGLSPRTIARILDQDGHAKHRAAMRAQRSEATFQNVALPEPDEPEETMPTNVVTLKPRRRRPSWKPRQPRRAEMLKWRQQFLGWTTAAREKAWLLIRDSKGDLPDDAYYSNDAAAGSDGGRPVASQERNARSSGA
jgi:hypothetical protein